MLLTITFSISRCHSGMQKNNPRFMWLHVVIAGHHVYAGSSWGFQCQQSPLSICSAAKGILIQLNEPSLALFSVAVFTDAHHSGPSTEAVLLTVTCSNFHISSRLPVPQSGALTFLPGCDPRGASHNHHSVESLGKGKCWHMSQLVPFWPKGFQRRPFLKVQSQK